MMAKPVEEIQDSLIVGDYLYLALGDHGVRVLDISDQTCLTDDYQTEPIDYALPRCTKEVGRYDTLGFAGGLAVKDNHLFVADGKGGLLVLDVSDPTHPVFALKYELNGSVQDVVIQGKLAFIANSSSGLAVIKIQPLTVTEPWLLKDEQNDVQGLEKIVVDAGWAYGLDAGGAVHIVDVSDQSTPRYFETITRPRLLNWEVIEIAANVNDVVAGNGRLYMATENGAWWWQEGEKLALLLDGTQGKIVRSVAIFENYLYLGLFGGELEVYDVKNPNHIVQVGTHKGVAAPHILAISKEYLFVADGRAGLRSVLLHDTWVLEDISKGDLPDAPLGGKIKDIRVIDDYIYLASCQQGLQIRKNGQEDQRDEQYVVKEFPGCAVAVKILVEIKKEGEKSYKNVFVANQNQGISIYDISTSRVSPIVVDNIDAGGAALDVEIRGDFLYIANGKRGFHIVNWKNATIEVITPNPRLGEDENVQDVFLDGQYAYIAAGYQGLQIIKITNPSGPEFMNAYDIDANARAVAVRSFIYYDAEGKQQEQILAFVVGGDDAQDQDSKDRNKASGLWIIDVSDPAKPRNIGLVEISDPGIDIALDIPQNIAYYLQEHQGVITIDVADPEDPKVLANQNETGPYTKLTLLPEKNLLYVAINEQGYKIFDTETPESLTLIDEFGVSAGIREMEIVNSYLYAVDGDQGMVIINLEKPEKLDVAKIISTPGEALGLTRDGDLIFIADGSKGLRVVEIINPEEAVAVGQRVDIHNALAVVVQHGYAFVANGVDGLVILEVGELKAENLVGDEEPPELKIVGIENRLAGPVLDVAVLGRYAYLAEGAAGLEIVSIANPSGPFPVGEIPDLTDVRQVEVSQDYKRLYVFDQVSGLRIYNIENPTKPKEIYASEAGAPVDMSSLEKYTFFIDGDGVLRSIYIPTEGDIREVKLSLSGGGSIPENATAMVAINHPGESGTSSFLLYMAMPGGQISTFDVRKGVDFSEVDLYETPGRASFKDMLFAFKAFGKGVYDEIKKGAQGKSLPAAVYDAFMQQGQLHIRGRVRDMLFVTLRGVLIFNLILFLGVVIASNAIFPVKTGPQRSAVIRHFLFYLIGRHGPITLVEGGKDKTWPGQVGDNRRGVVRASFNSAVVLEGCPLPLRGTRLILRFLRRRRQASSYCTRAVGPGLTFTRNGERVRGMVDLRKQIRLRLGVYAHTRDGIEVSSNVFLIFALGYPPEVLQVTYDGEEIAENIKVIHQRESWEPGNAPPQAQRQVEIIDRLADELDPQDQQEIHDFVQNHTVRHRRLHERPEITPEEEYRRTRQPFYFDPERVMDAIASEAYDTDTQEQIDWAELPAHTGVHLFREMLSQELYDDLYHPDDPQRPPIIALRQQFATRMRHAGLLSFEFVRRKDGRAMGRGDLWNRSDYQILPVMPLLSPKVLRQRGIRIIHAGFTALQPSLPEIQDYYLHENWRAPWEREALVIQSDHELQATRLRSQARVLAQRDMAYTLISILDQRDLTQEALALRVFQALDAAAADPVTRDMLPGEAVAMLYHLRHLLLPGDDDEDVVV